MITTDAHPEYYHNHVKGLAVNLDTELYTAYSVDMDQGKKLIKAMHKDRAPCELTIGVDGPVILLYKVLQYNRDLKTYHLPTM